jgi:hypothetical protein
MVTTKISAADMRSKWSKFSESESEAIKTVDALATQVEKSYGLPKEKAHSEVTAWVGQRTF